MAKAKGTTLVGAVKFLRSKREEARRVLAADLQHYLDETMRTSGLDSRTEETACRRSGAKLCSWRCTWEDDGAVS